MVTNCVNPRCSQPFRYLLEGRLFRLRLYPATKAAAPGDRETLVEYFWLCGSCSATFTLIFDERRGVSLAPFGNTHRQENRSTLILDITKYRPHDHSHGRGRNPANPKRARQQR